MVVWVKTRRKFLVFHRLSGARVEPFLSLGMSIRKRQCAHAVVPTGDEVSPRGACSSAAAAPPEGPIVNAILVFVDEDKYSRGFSDFRGGERRVTLSGRTTCGSRVSHIVIHRVTPNT